MEEENLSEEENAEDEEDVDYSYSDGEDKLPTVYDDAGNALGYTFTVDSIKDGVATLTFTKK